MDWSSNLNVLMFTNPVNLPTQPFSSLLLPCGVAHNLMEQNVSRLTNLMALYVIRFQNNILLYLNQDVSLIKLEWSKVDEMWVGRWVVREIWYIMLA